MNAKGFRDMGSRPCPSPGAAGAFSGRCTRFHLGSSCFSLTPTTATGCRCYCSCSLVPLVHSLAGAPASTWAVAASPRRPPPLRAAAATALARWRRMLLLAEALCCRCPGPGRESRLTPWLPPQTAVFCEERNFKAAKASPPLAPMTLLFLRLFQRCCPATVGHPLGATLARNECTPARRRQWRWRCGKSRRRQAGRAKSRPRPRRHRSASHEARLHLQELRAVALDPSVSRARPPSPSSGELLPRSPHLPSFLPSSLPHGLTSLSSFSPGPADAMDAPGKPRRRPCSSSPVTPASLPASGSASQAPSVHGSVPFKLHPPPPFCMEPPPAARAAAR
ncbi:uncharacterized protein [Triticum aestivum]|uniref:uncharacterized protein n=1 Tax=Triticum aestivum TaxID=4565 RepID=UPI001D00CB25|nr:uncharacterized protein LOC123053092 [Triticum aestivum]XP_044332422.1 uncharacterized protein LOC123053092 [Triticum aestivum]XP_044332423.1 uncharacterized protein LOC123053092 [Triticum aestivum]XP_044332424.1 uncharacterized protein LOC123053092 [Triticum aestivum]